jgi:hypothetical protein
MELSQHQQVLTQSLLAMLVLDAMMAREVGFTEYKPLSVPTRR